MTLEEALGRAVDIMNGYLEWNYHFRIARGYSNAEFETRSRPRREYLKSCLIQAIEVKEKIAVAYFYGRVTDPRWDTTPATSGQSR